MIYTNENVDKDDSCLAIEISDTNKVGDKIKYL